MKVCGNATYKIYFHNTHCYEDFPVKFLCNDIAWVSSIINLRHDVLGKTAYGKTLCALLVFISTIVEGLASSRAEGI